MNCRLEENFHSSWVWVRATGKAGFVLIGVRVRFHCEQEGHLISMYGILYSSIRMADGTLAHSLICTVLYLLQSLVIFVRTCIYTIVLLRYPIPSCPSLAYPILSCSIQSNPKISIPQIYIYIYIICPELVDVDYPFRSGKGVWLL